MIKLKYLYNKKKEVKEIISTGQAGLETINQKAEIEAQIVEEWNDLFKSTIISIVSSILTSILISKFL